jgi:hypothetical protein
MPGAERCRDLFGGKVARTAEGVDRDKDDIACEKA